MPVNTEIVENEDGKFMVISNDALCAHLKRGDRWEPHFTKIIKSLIKPGSAVVDAGAYIGCNTVGLAKQVGPGGAVFAFEPQRFIYQLLCGNCALNGLTNVQALNVALSARHNEVATLCPVDLTRNGVNLMDTALGAGGARVQLCSLDGLSLPKLSFLKLDVQGSELFVLEGGQNLIARDRPIIFIEIEEKQLLRQNVSAEALLQWFFGRGYSLLWLNNDYPVDFLAAPVEGPEIFAGLRAALPFESEVVAEFSNDFLAKFRRVFWEKTKKYRGE